MNFLYIYYLHYNDKVSKWPNFCCAPLENLSVQKWQCHSGRLSETTALISVYVGIDFLPSRTNVVEVSHLSALLSGRARSELAAHAQTVPVKVWLLLQILDIRA